MRNTERFNTNYCFNIYINLLVQIINNEQQNARFVHKNYKDIKIKTKINLNNISCTANCKLTTAATSYTVETCFFGYIIVNTLKKVINNNNNKNKSVRYYKRSDATPNRPITETAPEHKERK